MQNLEQNVINASAQPASTTVDTGKIRTGAGCRIISAQPASTTVDTGKIRTGAGCRIIVRKPATKRTADTGRIRMGAGCRIRTFAATALPAGSI